MFKTIGEIKRTNKANDGHFFDKGAMSFFNSRIESGVLKGKYFITSERMELTDPKRFTLRVANNDGSIDTVGEFQQFRSTIEAKEYLKELVK